MELNTINKFGTRQRIINAEKRVLDLLLIAMNYKKDVKFYITDSQNLLLGTLTKNDLIEKNEYLGDNPFLKDICTKDDIGILHYKESVTNMDTFGKMFENQEIVEIAVTEENTCKLLGIIDKRDFLVEYIKFKYPTDKPIILNDYMKKISSNETYLNKYAYNINSQHGEDGILEYVFKKIGVTSKIAVEFGGWDGIYLSNIRNLIMKYGFKGIFIEGDHEKCQSLIENYRDNHDVICLEGYVGYETNNSLDTFLKKVSTPANIDLVSIDIDGYDYHVWDALKVYRPRVVIIEYNPTISNDVIFINPKAERIFKGSSAAAIVNLGRSKGYSLIAATKTNLIFIVDEEYEKIEIYDNSLEALRPASLGYDSHFFQTYDKTVMCLGNVNYIWDKGKPFADEKDKNIEYYTHQDLVMYNKYI